MDFTRYLKVARFKEFNKDETSPSIKDCMSKQEYPHKKIIYNYLLNGRAVMAGFNPVHDILDGEIIAPGVIYMVDDKYMWTLPIAHYVDKYNLQLPEDFVEHVLSKNKQNVG